jgi:hypothetical protein
MCRVSGQNSKWLAFGFTEKCLFTVKTCQKSVFHPRDHIVSQIDVSMLYKKIRGFEKYRVSAENPKHDFCFTKKSLFVMKTGQKLHFIPVRPILCPG